MHDAQQAGAGRRLWAAVPFKGPVGSKRRLAALLSPEERARLSVAMLNLVLGELLRAEAIERVLLLTPPGLEPVWPEHARLLVVDEPPAEASADGLNPALRRAQATAATAGVARLLIVPGDLPLIGAEDVAVLVESANEGAVIIAPDRAETGTNALLLTPPTAIVPGFGEGSFERHQRLASDAGLTVAVVQRPGLALDLDTPADVARLLALSPRSGLAGLLRELQVEQRLAQAAVSGA
jgi:2-phospho-L-lactate guanylyltransferase